MSNAYTNRLKKRKPAPGDFNWDDEWHDNEEIDDVVAGALLSANRVISGGAVTAGSGLTANFAAAVVRLNGAQLNIDAGSLVMSAAQAGKELVNWIYVDGAGNVVTLIIPPSGNYIPLALVDTNDTGIVRIADLRPMIGEVVNKDVSDGVPGLTQLKINFMNALGTIKSFFTNANTVARTYTFQDRNGTIADDTDLATINSALAGKAPLASPAMTGTPTAPTAAPGTNTTQLATTAFVAAAVAAGGSQSSILHVQDQKSTGTAGGSAGSGVQTRTLNTVLKNEITGASLASNQITLPAGGYRIRANAYCYAGNRHKLFLYSITGSANIAEGMSHFANSGTGVNNIAILNCEITLAAGTVLELRHYIQNAQATNGLGEPVSQGLEIYSEVIIEKVA